MRFVLHIEEKDTIYGNHGWLLAVEKNSLKLIAQATRFEVGRHLSLRLYTDKINSSYISRETKKLCNAYK